MIQVLDITQDEVINSKVLIAKSNYEFSLSKIYPLINKLDIQRNVLNKSFYTRLEKDILDGCIMPALTLALIGSNTEGDIQTFQNYLNENINKAFVLDGIQRLNTLKKASENLTFPERYTHPIYFNIIICDSMNELLYRMITLNNGQKAMSVRHQIEILTQNLLNIDVLKIKIQTEKERKKQIIPNSFAQSDLTLSYLAFLTKSINIDNQKIIESKMDEILVNKVIENDAIYASLEFSDIVNNIVAKFSINSECFKWFNNTNNLVGFFAGIFTSYDLIKDERIEDFQQTLENFENSFKDLNISKIKVGTLRRKLVSYFFENYSDLKNLDSLSLTTKFMDENLL